MDSEYPKRPNQKWLSHSLKVNNANFAPAQCQLCDNARCVIVSYNQLIFNSKTRTGAKLALCKTMSLCKKVKVN